MKTKPAPKKTWVPMAEKTPEERAAWEKAASRMVAEVLAKGFTFPKKVAK